MNLIITTIENYYKYSKDTHEKCFWEYCKAWVKSDLTPCMLDNDN